MTMRLVTTTPRVPGPVRRDMVVAGAGADLPLSVEHAASRVEFVLFDLDRTLTHFDRRGIGRFFKEMCGHWYGRLAETGRELPTLRRYTRRMTTHFAGALLWAQLTRREMHLFETVGGAHARMGIHLRRDEVQDVALPFIPAILERLTVDEHALAMVDALHRRGIRMGLVSNTFSPHFVLDQHLESVGLLKYFPVRVYSSDVRYMKPHREIFRVALQRLGAPADKTVFVGDRMRNDVRGASRLGMTTILLAPNGRVRRARIMPDFVVRQLREIPDVIASLDD